MFDLEKDERNIKKKKIWSLPLPFFLLYFSHHLYPHITFFILIGSCILISLWISKKPSDSTFLNRPPHVIDHCFAGQTRELLKGFTYLFPKH